MKNFPRLIALCVLLSMATWSAQAQPGAEVLGPGSKLDTLSVGGTTYQQVQIRS